MREIVESTLISLDGVVDDPGSWALDYFDDQFLEEAYALLKGCDAMLMGRGTYEDLSWRWPGQKGDFADAINGIRKFVFSSTLDRADWNNSVIVRGDVVDEVRALKADGDGDLVVFGSALGPFLENPKTPLSLVGTHARRSGVVVLNYTVDRS